MTEKMPDSTTDYTTNPTGLTECDREPIHIPGSIQPHGLLLLVDRESLVITAVAGDVEGRLAPSWQGRRLSEVLGHETLLEGISSVGAAHRLRPVHGTFETFDALARHVNHGLAVELEPAPKFPLSAAEILSELDMAATAFERAPDLLSLCGEAATVFRQLTGFDRVMIYQFLEDGAGVVLAEAKAAEVGSFLNHHFPASDIPQQARALYVRNRVRVIPDVNYIPAPLRPSTGEVEALDMSDIGLRSVSPIHLQYLRNMGVGASASISLVRDGALWGLIACHNRTQRPLPYELRVAGQTLAGGLSRQIRAKEEALQYRERIRLRAAEDETVSRLSGDEPLEKLLSASGNELRMSLRADGFAVVSRSVVDRVGTAPADEDIRRIAEWVTDRGQHRAFSTHALGELFPTTAQVAAVASGLLAVTITGDDPIVLLWFRAEQIEVVNWAGNPHKELSADPQAALTPRASFAAWSETVRGRSRRWSLVECETVTRLARSVIEARQSRRIRELNRQLTVTVAENEQLLQHKDYLMREVNHRVQNSLQLVSSFLRLQARAHGGTAANPDLEDAQRRIAAVALVHRQLYGAEHEESVDLARYLSDLCQELTGSMGGEEWSPHIHMDFAPVLVAADRAVRIGLILTELVLNTAKYAYGGSAGPVFLALEQHDDRLRLIVADVGVGKKGVREGFGTKMLVAMVRSLEGTLDETDNAPGLRTTVTAPIVQ